MKNWNNAIAFYANPETANRVLKKLKRNSFRRSAAIQRDRGMFKISSYWPSSKLIISSLTFILLSLILFILLPQFFTILAPIIVLAGALLAIWWAMDVIHNRINPQVISRISKWIVGQETLIIVQVKSNRVREALEILRHVESGHPTSFLLRSESFEASPEKDQLIKEPLTYEQMEEISHELAISLKEVEVKKKLGNPLLKRLRESSRILAGIRHDVGEAEHLEQTITASAEWLIDNTYVIQGNIEEIQRNLPQKYYHDLPKLKEGPYAGLPRVYVIAKEIVYSTANKLSRENITDFLNGYQAIEPLTIGELWALPLMLRLRLIECIQYLALDIDRRLCEGEMAGFWGNRLLLAVHHESDRVSQLIEELNKEVPNPSAHFAEELFDHLYDEERVLPLVKKWIENRFGTNINDIIRDEQVQKTAEQIAFSSAIVSLITLSHLSWRDIFESVSPIDKILDQDPDDIYSNMDFGTRDTYRKSVEKIARGSNKTESNVAYEALQFSLKGDNAVNRHVGYYLIDKGKPALQNSVGYRLTFLEKIQRWMLKHPAFVYLGTLSFVIALIEGIIIHQLILWNVTPLFIALTAFLALIPVSECVIQIVNLVLSRLLPPFVLPKMLFEEGIPEKYKTVVVIPTLLSNHNAIEDNLERLEIHYLANQDPVLRFGLLVDFIDAPSARMETDLPLLETAEKGILALEEKYGGAKFFLLYRERSYSESERAWIGWERKRGKLESLNRFLVEGDHPDIILKVGDPNELKDIRFAITLDSDTQLPKDTAKQMVSTLSHPLNAPRFDSEGNITRGYTIIQPRVNTNFVHTELSLFSHIFADEMVVDPYTQAVSNVYQDLMQEGTYHGKGIYDVQAFHKILTGRFPQEHLLSHDLIEGIYGRVAFASDILLLDLFPKDYLTWARRQHRWMRGDWQIIDWLFSKVPNAKREKIKNTLSLISRWKIFDNLRRALLPVANLCLLIVAWLFSAHPLLWTLIVLLTIFLPTINLFLSNLISDPRIFLLSRGPFINSFLRALITLALIPHQAYLSIDAFCRVFYRRLISKQRLLEWLVAHHAAGQVRRNFKIKLVAISFVSLFILVGVYYLNPLALKVAVPLVLFWFVSPIIIHFLDQSSIEEPGERLKNEDKIFLRHVARYTWRYFDDFVGPQSNWLPPDNYQSSLLVEVAQRTSSTNIGLWMLAVLSAYDFKYITSDEVVDRILGTFETMKKLELFEGHLLNWYDTHNLRPLYPRYVSTVDSGNFLASLWTLEQGLYEMISEDLLPPSILKGIRDVFELMMSQINDPEVVHKLMALKGLLKSTPKTWLSTIAVIKQSLKYIEDFNHSINIENMIFSYWSKQLQKDLEGWECIISRYFSWYELISVCPQEFQETKEKIFKTKFSLESIAAGKLLEFLPDHSSDPYYTQLKSQFEKAQWLAGEKLGIIHNLVDEIHRWSEGMNMEFLYNKDRKLFSIGFHVDDRKLDASYYDLLASEARIASLVAIAKDDVPLDHWWALGRSYRYVDGKQVLMSWGGTMFEYLMPCVFNYFYRDSLLGEACDAAVVVQRDYGKKRGIPWGISEAAYSEIDMRRIYQYRSFGVPGLGFKQGLENDLVVSPYSSALALMIRPVEALKNLKSMTKGSLNMLSTYGFYESIDFARQRGPHGERGVIVYAYMAHHQGMALLSFDNLLNNQCMPRRFHANPRISGVESLLSEKVPIFPPIAKGFRSERPLSRLTPFSSVPIMGMVDTPHSTTPKVNLLSNGDYSVMVTNSGGGYSRWREFDITRWYPDTTRDFWGSYIYIKDMNTKEVWSNTFQPVRTQGHNYSVSFKADKVEIKRRDHDVETTTDIVVSPEDNAEIRLLTIANISKEDKFLELTTYSELVLAPHATDRAHPVFNKMFIETEGLQELSGIIAFRRLRSPEDKPIFAVHSVACDQPSVGPIEFETDRNLFLGRGRSIESPRALDGSLSNSQGYVLDPIFSLRYRLKIRSGQRIQIAFTTAVADNRDRAVMLIKKYSVLPSAHRALEMAWTSAQLELRHLRIHQEEAQLFQKLASRILFPHAQLRPPTDQLKRNVLGQSHLWAYGISGDLPIVAVTVADPHDIDLVKQVLTAHAFWRLRGLRVDLVIFNEEAASYEHPLFEQLLRIVQSHSHHAEIGKSGGVFLINCDQIPPEDLALILSVARANLIAARGFLRQQLVSPGDIVRYPQRLLPDKSIRDETSGPLPFMELEYYNDWGGFTQDGREYAIYLGENANTPLPWINVIANPLFGTLVTETGLGTTWYGNSQTNRLTPWSNDPVINSIADAIYIRDEQLGIFWTLTPSPIRESEAYRIRHGQGYTTFEHNSHGIDQELTIFVPVDDQGGLPLRIQRVKLTNTGNRKRVLSLTSYTELVLGTTHEETELHLITEWDPESQSIFAYNRYNNDFGSYLAFAFSDPLPSSFTGSRTEFLGRNHHHSNPAALRRKGLSGVTGGALDPCAALQIHVTLEPGETKEVSFFLGYAEDPQKARALINQARVKDFVDKTFDSTVHGFWDRILGTIHIETPDHAINFTLNRWVLYQTLSCRFWGRTAFYQSSGAFGFRDQLQDSMALLYSAPQLTKEQILRAAAHQFVEGDVQHWWHPPSNGGVRTRISDDLLWLPFVTAQYIRVTNDLSILDEVVPFIKGDALKEHEDESYFVPQISEESGTILEHCRRAIHKGITAGPHGLPLIGCGDWNDGMNRVGIGGKGESVWLAWFLIHVMKDFAEILNRKNQQGSADGFLAQAKRLADVIEAQAWDGNWYTRAYFDDGTPLGSKYNQEDMIDSLPQSWAVISGLGDPVRAKLALESVEQYLVKEDEGLVLLLTPAFDKTPTDPGYIKGYPPGVRENGGQYTHGSLWMPLAFARLNEGDKAVNILDIMHPVAHSHEKENVLRYKVEPYAIVADIYNLPGQVGRGGWTWYTGAAGWTYRVWLEEILGFHLRGDILAIEPVLPKAWEQVKMVYRYHETTYEISILNPNHLPNNNLKRELDGVAMNSREIKLVNDGKTHTIKVIYT